MKGRLALGSIFILLGSGLLFDQLGYINFGDIVSMYWPIVLILIGIFGLFDKRESKLFNIIILTLGILLQLNKLEYISVNIFRLILPIILIIAGLNMILSKREDRNM